MKMRVLVGENLCEEVHSTFVSKCDMVCGHSYLFWQYVSYSWSSSCDISVSCHHESNPIDQHDNCPNGMQLLWGVIVAETQSHVNRTKFYTGL